MHYMPKKKKVNKNTLIKYDFVNPKNEGYIVEHSSNIYVLDKKLQVKKIIPNGIPSTEITRIVRKFL